MSIDTSVGRVEGVRVSIDTSVQVSGQGSGSKSRRLTAPNAKSVKFLPGKILELQFSPDSKTHKTPKRRRQAASPVDNGHSGQHRSCPGSLRWMLREV